MVHTQRKVLPLLTTHMHAQLTLCAPFPQVADVYRKVRFTLRYLLGNLTGYDPSAHAVPYAQLAFADRYILARFAALADECSAAYASFQFYRWVCGWA
jgi:isoleucyl-tRNA synthetase